MRFRLSAILLILSILCIAIIPFSNASSPYYYYVNSRDTTYQQWTRVGSTPYLNAIDYPTNYIYIIGKLLNKLEGDFSFANPGSETSETLSKVYIETYCKGVYDPDVGPNVAVSVYDGSSWSTYYLVATPASFGWVSIDVTTKLDTWTKVTNAKARYRYITVSSTDNAYIDCVRLKTETTIAKSWHHISLTMTLNTRSWNHHISSIFILNTRSWVGHHILLTFDLIGKSWHHISWIKNLIGRSWFHILWNFQAIVMGWHSLMWQFFTGPSSNIAELFIGIIFLGCIISGIIFLKMRRK